MSSSSSQRIAELTAIKDDLSADQLQSLGKEYQQLSTETSHFSDQGAEWNTRVDSPDSDKFKVMDRLAKQLGRQGTSFETILETMGEPNVTSANLESDFESPPFMPGPIIGDQIVEEEGFVYAKYYWRGNHDYLWFKLRQSDGSVVTYGWYNAME